MELAECIVTRWSCRAFKSDPVPLEIIQDILTMASRAPSYMNTQPWEVAVVTREVLYDLNKKRLEMARENVAANLDIPLPRAWPDIHQQRAQRFSAQRQQAISMGTGDKEGIENINAQANQFFGAPCAIFLYMDRSLSTWSIFDVGLFTQTLILAAHDKGLGSCIEATVVRYPDEVRKILGIPGTKSLVVGIALGYPETGAAINTFRTDRTDIGEFTRWYS